MSRIIRILSEAQQRKLAGEFVSEANAENPETAPGTVPGRDKAADAVDAALQELERLKVELLQLQEDQKSVLLSLRDVVDRL